MGAIVVATTIGLVAIGLVLGIVVLAVFALAGIKALNAAHDGRSRFVNRTQRQRS
ncbi:hypothetical protein [Saccharopolyspora sp. CA-218241]|uniref:hypothetical protein n=1 Tax=Saccharopolyspora sp. CA-218241 TaxID=3240027 RepID=UPI003D9948E5